MDYLLKVTLIGLASGIAGTGLGGLAAFFVNRISRRWLSLTMEFSAGLMTSVVCFQLIPESFEYGGKLSTFIGIFAGILTILLIEEYIRRLDFIKTAKEGSGLLKAGILMSIGIALHNLPEGFAVGSGFGASVSLGVLLTAVIVIHDIPEGVAMAVPMRAGGFSKSKAFILTALSGVPMGVGALIGAVLGGISQKFIGMCLGFAAGAMLYVVYGELVIESKRLYLGRLPSIGNICGIICGIIISLFN
ncbi:MAG: ZIP family metal transporter [Clostridiaceae bacterium]|nr:ZIP family metal transporter [Clostridiaceae bacterium]